MIFPIFQFVWCCFSLTESATKNALISPKEARELVICIRVIDIINYLGKTMCFLSFMSVSLSLWNFCSVLFCLVVFFLSSLLFFTKYFDRNRLFCLNMWGMDVGDYGVRR